MRTDQFRANQTRRHSQGSAVARLLTFSLVLQWGGARIFNFDPTAVDGGTQGTIISQLLILLTNAITFWVLVNSPRSRALLRQCGPIVLLPGLAIVSALWSVYPYLTLRSAISYALSTLLGFAIAGALPPLMAFAVMVRAMGYCCVLSVLVALLLPELGVHQANDAVQAVHAGYWRGILGHKIGLGILAGLALPLLVLHGRLAFRLGWPIVAVCAFVCLVNAASMTAYLGSLLFSVLLLSFRFVPKGGGSLATTVVNAIVWITTLLVISMAFGALNSLALLFDKSSDLTGRADMWPLISATIASNPLGLWIGYGYVAGMKAFVAPSIASYVGMVPSDAHNGYLEVQVAFGYLGGIVVAFSHFWLFQGIRRLPLDAPKKYAGLSAVPISLFFAGALLNYSESLLMSYGSMFAVLTPLAAGWLVRLPEGGRQYKSGIAGHASMQTPPVDDSGERLTDIGRLRRAPQPKEAQLQAAAGSRPKVRDV